MYFIYSICATGSYLINNTLGIVVSSVIFTTIIFQKKDFINKNLECLILSLPLSYVSITGINPDRSHMVSWYTLFLAIYILYFFVQLYKKKVTIKLKYLVPILFVFIWIFVRNLFLNNLTFLVDFIQIVITIIPIFIGVCYKKKSLKINIDIFNKLKVVCLSTAVLVIIQSIAYKLLGIELGYITFFRERITFDVLFTGFSELSIFIGIGVLISSNKLLDQFSYKDLFGILIMLTGMVINSSRTGLISVIAVFILMYLQKISTKETLSKKLSKFSLLLVAIAIGYFGLKLLLEKRTTIGGNIFDDNGRFITYGYALDAIFKNATNFLFGIGLNPDNYGMIPHNFILEILLQNGIIVLSFFIIGIIFILKEINKNPYKYTLYYILISSLFVTSFFAKTYLTVIIIILLCSIDKKTYTGENDE